MYKRIKFHSVNYILLQPLYSTDIICMFVFVIDFSLKFLFEHDAKRLVM